jgi:hydrogenase nickel incorporation protein HypA/HybF
MHELTVASRLVDRALSAAAERDAERIDGLTVAVGEATHLAPEQLEFCISAALEGTVAEGAAVSIESVPPTGACDCGWRGEPARVDATVAAPRRHCPECGATIELTAGDDCRLTSIEIP